MATTDINKMSAAEIKAALKEKQRREKETVSEKRRQYDNLRDQYIDTTFEKIEQLSGQLREFKTDSVKLGLELHTKMYEAYDRVASKDIDSYTLTNKEGTRRIMIERQHRCEYDETSTIAIDTIRTVLRDKFEGRNKGMYNIIDSILMKNGTGDYDERLIARLRKHESTVDDARFSEALDMLAKAYKPTTSVVYIRAYRRQDGTGKWMDMPMNWSSM